MYRACVLLSDRTYKTVLRNCAIDLEGHIENCVRERQTWTAVLGRSGRKAGAQVMEQGLEFVLLICLRFIVCAPRLRIGGKWPIVPGPR